MSRNIFETATALATEGRFKAALASLEKGTRSPSTGGSPDVLRAELLERVGQFGQSRILVQGLLKSKRAAMAEQSSCEFILGKIEWEEGAAGSAISHIQRAVALADATGDLPRKCWAHLWLLILVADRAGPNAAAPILAEVRRDATRLGDAHVLATLHVFAAQIDTKRGLLKSALGHLTQAEELLRSRRNVWLEAQLEFTRANVSILRSNHRLALHYAHHALELAEESGGAAGLRACLGNLSIIFYLLGQFDEAVNGFSRAMTILPSNGDSRRSMVDALARVRLTQGNLEACASLLDQLDLDESNSDDRLIYAHRYVTLTKSQLLARQGKYSDAFHEINRTLELADEAQDRFLSQVATLTKSHFLQQTKRESEALELLGSFLTGFTGQSPDTYANYEMIIACLLAASGRVDSARAHRHRAERIYRGVAHMPGSIELERSWVQAIGNSVENDSTIPTQVVTPASTTQSIAALMMLAERPELLARGIVDLLNATAAVHKAIAAIERVDGTYEVLGDVGEREDRYISVASLPRRIAIGHMDEQSIDVWVSPKADVESVATLNAVTLLLSAIHEIERGRAEREERLTLWPIEDVPIQNVGQAIVQGRMREVMELARRVATTNAGVLIIGESGTGKEILARAIHTYSERADKPLVPFNCAALPREMLESQLFGHRRGAFTGADRDNPGVIRSARGGTLFLDEVGELSLDLQPKLLRFLESGEICPLGETTPFTVDVRVIAATNANLEHAVKNGRFREDLFYRLNVVPLHIPPLRERRDEIPALVHHFVMRAAAEYRKGQVRIAENTMEQLLLFQWPGNVRQLQNELRRMVALAEPDAVLTPRALTPEIASVRAESPARPRDSLAASFPDKLPPTLARIEREMIQAALREHQGRMEATAKALGISRKGLYLKRQRLGL